MPLVLTGPTACGKSGVAIALARLTGAEIVCADAYQLYRGLPVLTAQPPEADQREIPHWLYGSIPLTEEMDARRFAEMAVREIDAITQRGRPVIVTGGSGLYVKALTHGLADLPPLDESLRAEVLSLAPDEAVARLNALDPDAAQTVNLRNPRYVQRALEIIIQTGRPLAEVKANFAAGPRPGFRGIVLQREREELYARINERTAGMFAAGVLEEVRTIRDIPLSATAAKTLGLAEIKACLAGTMPVDAAISTIRQATRHYAKRQITWFRRETWMESIPAGERSAEATARAIMDSGGIP